MFGIAVVFCFSKSYDICHIKNQKLVKLIKIMIILKTDNKKVKTSFSCFLFLMICFFLKKKTENWKLKTIPNILLVLGYVGLVCKLAWISRRNFLLRRDWSPMISHVSWNFAFSFDCCMGYHLGNSIFDYLWENNESAFP